MSIIEKNLNKVKLTISDPSCVVVAISKTKPNEDILQAYEAGHRDFGENKAQELTKKYKTLPKDISWHMVGHVQSNKVKYIAPFVKLMHGIDSLKLLKTINKEAKKNKRVISCLLQIHIANEDTKFGFSSQEVFDLIESNELAKLHNVKIVGLMGMASNVSDHRIIRAEFKGLKHLFDLIKEQKPELELETLSMGMSGDYQIAIEEGSTMVRIGTGIFGKRPTRRKVLGI